MAYRLLAEMRIELYRKLDALAPAYLLRRRSGDLVALATQDIETVEYFFAHTVAPAFVAVLVPARCWSTLAVVAWPLALALLPFLAYAGAVAGAGAAAHRPARLRSARDALGELGAMSPRRSRAWPNWWRSRRPARRRDGFMARVRRYQATAARRCCTTCRADRAAGGRDRARRPGGRGGRRAAGRRTAGSTPTLLPLLILLSVAAFLPVSEIAQVGRQLADTIASTRRLHVVHAEPVAITDGPRVPAGAARRLGGALRACALHLSGPRSGRRWRMSTFDVPAGATVALVGPSGAGKTTHRQPAAALLGSRRRARSCSTASICAI